MKIQHVILTLGVRRPVSFGEDAEKDIIIFWIRRPATFTSLRIGSDAGFSMKIQHLDTSSSGALCHSERTPKKIGKIAKILLDEANDFSCATTDVLAFKMLYCTSFF